MRLHKEQEAICRRLNDPNGLAITLVNQAHLLAFSLSQPAAALPLAEEAARLAAKHGLIALDKANRADRSSDSTLAPTTATVSRPGAPLRKGRRQTSPADTRLTALVCAHFVHTSAIIKAARLISGSGMPNSGNAHMMAT